MMRTRASIKGIGATIFHDSDIPESSLLPRSNRYLFAAREPAKAATPEPEAPLPKASPAPQQAEQAGPAAKPESAAGGAGISYSTEDLIALLDAEAQAGVTEAELARLARAAVQGGALPAEQARGSRELACRRRRPGSPAGGGRRGRAGQDERGRSPCPAGGLYAGSGSGNRRLQRARGCQAAKRQRDQRLQWVPSVQRLAGHGRAGPAARPGA